jgi:outer membrane protein with beta-barrel domain
MRALASALVVGLISVSAVSVTAQAQDQPGYTRKGFWFTVGGGYGSAGIGCNGCGDLHRESGVSGFIGLGGTINPHLQLGFESNGWSKSEGGETVTLGTGTLTAHWYPSATGGFFAKGGVGLGFQEVSFSGASDSRTGFGVSGGVGIDVPVSGKVAITPTVSYSRGWLGNVGGASGYHIDVIQVAVGLTLP